MGRSRKKEDGEQELERSSVSTTQSISRGYEHVNQRLFPHSVFRVDEPPPDPSDARHETPIAVVEQRISNLAQGSLCLVLLSGPFLHLLHLIPRGVLAGLL